ncbi:cobalamin B12-binding domain-containing protein [Acetobacterium bakii]|uniref:Cobalamin-binding protein n=1 Tax=Acetobacterium bakii TaxID=52689 RepID=A0A0L6TZ14_9FIRM|nr:cobalamin-dependent protein [Acetobacterium bakii]KNZ41488.1 cobalamin-binding protein [Acetobacterium bakii]
MLDLKRITELVGELEEEQLLEVLADFTKASPSADEAATVVQACQEGMTIIGDRFSEGEYFIGDLVFGGELLTNTIKVLKPFLGESDSTISGKILLGTVAGDLHDIGKNIFRGMAEAAGFEVVDIGIDAPIQAFVDMAKEVEPQIIGMSGVLTLALDAMKDTTKALKAAGIDSKIIIGGNPVTQEACEDIGADAFTTNAAQGVKICQGWV